MITCVSDIRDNNVRLPLSNDKRHAGRMIDGAQSKRDKEDVMARLFLALTILRKEIHSLRIFACDHSSGKITCSRSVPVSRLIEIEIESEIGLAKLESGKSAKRK